MVIVAVDPNKKDLKLLVKYLRIVFPGCEAIMFSDSEAAALYIRDNPIDVLFTEAVMLGISGFDLQARLNAVQPAVLTVFVTATDAYANQALKTRAQGYILKPATREAVRSCMKESKFGSGENQHSINESCCQ